METGMTERKGSKAYKRDKQGDQREEPREKKKAER
jgi:hypothetical protein